MNYKLLYIVAEEVGLKSKGLSGTLSLEEDHLEIVGPERIRFLYDEIQELRIFRQHKVGTLIQIRAIETSVYLAVPRFNLFGIFAMINYFKTHELFEELKRRAKLENS